MCQVMGLRNIENTDPLEFEIRLEDKENTEAGVHDDDRYSAPSQNCGRG
jgi:hypothetical protein